MMDAPTMQTPVLTMPAAEAALLCAAYAEASVILEYGLGGSTVIAGQRDGATVFCVESDRAWLRRMERWFAHHPPRARVHLHHASIGPTGKWGMPQTDAHFRAWPGYPLSVWDHPDFLHPDVILIDGRFRPACLLTAALRIARPVTVLFDDYAERPAYHAVEAFVQPTRLIGRMAEFHLTPMAFPAERMSQILTFFLRPS
jgi:hypothetical protein